MSKLVVTSTTNSILVEYNDYSPSLEAEGGCWRKEDIRFLRRESKVSVIIKGESEWFVSFDGNGQTLKIDKINNQTPSSNLDLYNKLTELIA
jgi:hypothetical protein